MERHRRHQLTVDFSTGFGAPKASLLGHALPRITLLPHLGELGSAAR
jgi:hypothetical protein